MAASSASDLQASSAAAAAREYPVAARASRSRATKTSTVGKYAICLIMATFLHASFILGSYILWYVNGQLYILLILLLISL